MSCELLAALVGYPVVSPRARRNVAQRSSALRLGAGLALAALLFFPPPAAVHAQGIPVNDSAAIVQLLAQITSLGNIYTRQNDELTQALRLVQSLTTTTAYGTGFDAALPGRLRRALPHQMRNLNSLHLPANQTTRTSALFGTIRDRYGLMDYDAGGPADPAITTEDAQAWRANRDAQLATAVSTQVVFDSLDEREDSYERAMTALDSHADLKQSVDLLARLTAENGRLLMDLIRVQAQAAQATVTARLNEETHRAKMRKVGTYEPTLYPW